MTIKEELELHNAHIAFKKLSGNHKGFVVKNMDGYTIVLNSSIAQEAQLKALKHELAHIRRGDLFNPAYVEYAG